MPCGGEGCLIEPNRDRAFLDPSIAILGFARRMTGYKRPLLLFSDVDRLVAIASRHPIQIVLAGKAHPNDKEGRRRSAAWSNLLVNFAAGSPVSSCRITTWRSPRRW